ncbi:Protein CBG12397 [Caenorhabditis briggsae]|uniref:Major sperm protein n=1 Tax=Caenorhabditis briggsae TaxID=6238 RepID=A8XFC1_CAEBR|nr:Protein CBG12397 [Caenorhabditis briggsae]CAP31382.1 Protein CBG12397 [Caenorhabditis briggsae]
MLVPLTAIVTTSLPMAAAIALCAKDRKTTHVKNKGKSAKSTRSSKSAHGKSSKSGKSSRSHRSKSQRSKRSSKSGKKGKSSKSGKGGKSGKSKKSGKSSKSKKQVKEGATTSASAASAGSAASEKSTKSSKSSRKSSKSSKSRKARRLDSDAQYKMEKSGKSSKNSAACAAAPKPVSKVMNCSFPIVVCKQSTGGKQMEKSLVEEVNAIKHSNQLSVFPAKLQYQTLGGVSQIELKNTSGERKAYKLKCSDNALYRVNPVFGFAEPHSTAKIDVLRLNGEQKTDKLVFLTTNAKDAADPHEAFAKQTEQREMMVVPLVAA